MALGRVVPVITALIFSCSFPLLAGAAGSPQEAPVSSLEISASSQQASPEAACELKVKERYQYYDIDGLTVKELLNQMKHNGTKWDDGKTYAALTTWNLNFRYDISEQNDKYFVKSVRTDVEIVYHLPRKLSAGSELAAVWENYMDRLKRHEFGHKDITVKTAGEINEILASLPKYSNPKELEREAKRRTDQKLKQLKVLQVAYDDDTRHGETQGAILAAN